MTNPATNIMTEKLFAVELSENGRKWKETVGATTAAQARREVRKDNPDAMMWDVDTV